MEQHIGLYLRLRLGRKAAPWGTLGCAKPCKPVANDDELYLVVAV